jgi:hypothetical protein
MTAATASGLLKHGIDHVSASSLNLWAAEPALWVMQRLLRKRAPVAPAAHIGTAVEAGVEAALLGLAQPLTVAGKKYDALCGDAEARKRIGGMLERALGRLLAYGAPDLPTTGERQQRVEIGLEGVPVPCVGYTDFVFGRHGTVIERHDESDAVVEVMPYSESGFPTLQSRVRAAGEVA